MSVIHFKNGKRLHINAENGATLCKKPISKDAVAFNDCPNDGWFCPECMKEVGYEMLGDYLSNDAFTGKTLQQILSTLKEKNFDSIPVNLTMEEEKG